MADLVHHVISAGLERGKYYRVYATQVNTSGIESGRSDPSYIRVGDVTGPPAPLLSLDTSYGVNGFQSNNGFVDVGIKWNTPVCDDLWQYYVYTAENFDAYTADGIYPKNSAVTTGYQKSLTGATNSFVLPRQNQGWLYIGIQAIDYSHNLSDIYVIKVMAEDTSSILRPTNHIHVEQGLWSIKVWTECPESNQIAYVLFFRDGWKQLSPVPFASGLFAEIIDQLDPIDGLTHWYTYCYMDRNGHLSPMSEPSNAVCSGTINTEHINQVQLEALRQAWRTDNVQDIESIKQAVMTQSETTRALAQELSSITQSYRELYDNYTLVANKIELLSASSEVIGNDVTTMQTSITQMSNDIELRATKATLNNVTGNIANAYTSLIDVQADRIDLLSTGLYGNETETGYLTVLSNQIEEKVSSGDLSASIDLAIQEGISTAQITADRIVLNGRLLIGNDARIAGRLYADNISLVNSDNSIAWGSGGTIVPKVINLTDSNYNYGYARDWNGWHYHADRQFTFSPSTNVSFSGSAGVKITATFEITIAVPVDNYCDENGNYNYGIYDNYSVQAFVWQNTEGNPNENWTTIDSLSPASIELGSLHKGVREATDYFEKSCVYNGTLTYERHLSLPTGTAVAFTPYLRTSVNNSDFPALPGKFGIVKRTYHIECT